MRFFFLAISILISTCIYSQVPDDTLPQTPDTTRRVIPVPVPETRVDSIRVPTIVDTPERRRPVRTNPVVVRDSVRTLTQDIQQQDSILTDTISINTSVVDTVSPPAPKPQVPERWTAIGDPKIFEGKEPEFYFIIFLLILFGLLKLAFAKYYNDLQRVFFRTTLKQRQISEQLVQSPLPAILFNLFFSFSFGMYLNYLLDYLGFVLHKNFWIQYLYCVAGLLSIYAGKFISMKFIGWLFRVPRATDSYIFIVFLINKMLGLFVLPILIFLAFSTEVVREIAFVISWLGIAVLLIYRLILSYGAVRNEITLNPFHFLLYLAAFEIIPLLLIYKLLLIIF